MNDELGEPEPPRWYNSWFGRAFLYVSAAVAFTVVADYFYTPENQCWAVKQAVLSMESGPGGVKPIAISDVRPAPGLRPSRMPQSAQPGVVCEGTAILNTGQTIKVVFYSAEIKGTGKDDKTQFFGWQQR